ncbi:MAG: hypothetical protein PUP91_11600 [Rhizonema sp. PD37]|nr:hypothetical protein [Rhizonema sp. PD37]
MSVELIGFNPIAGIRFNSTLYIEDIYEQAIAALKTVDQFEPLEIQSDIVSFQISTHIVSVKAPTLKGTHPQPRFASEERVVSSKIQVNLPDTISYPLLLHSQNLESTHTDMR